MPKKEHLYILTDIFSSKLMLVELQDQHFNFDVHILAQEDGFGFRGKLHLAFGWKKTHDHFPFRKMFGYFIIFQEEF